MATKEELEAKYFSIINAYHDFKPILASLYTKNGNTYVEGIANEIRALNDHLARCYRRGIDIDQAYEELCKAEGHLKRLIFDSFKQLNIIFHDFTEDYENKYFGVNWILLDKGKFWKDYCQYRKNAITYVDSAKNCESIDYNIATQYYQNAYVSQEKVYDLIKKNDKDLKQGFFNKFLYLFASNKMWIVLTIALAVIPALLWEFIRNFTMILDKICSSLIEIMHSVGEILVGL